MRPGAVDVWFGVLRSDPSLYRDDYALLSDSERAIADQRRTPEMRCRYAEIHAQKRRILARYVNRRPQTIAIATGEYGKPYWVDHADWSFNLSHSGDCYIIAVAKNCRLGIDIEQLKDRPNVAGLVAKCFAPTEIAYWQALPEERRNGAFYRCWTRKEAFVKATGRGIVLGLDRCVTDPNDPRRMLEVPDDYGPASLWHLVDLALPGELVGAVAVDREIETLQLRKIV
ncbi:MAG: hypothetical protein Kow0065_09510 [Methylomicrobium sp.]